MQAEAVYRISYYTGIQTIRLWRRIMRFLTLLFLPFRLLLWRGARALKRVITPRRHREGFAGVQKRIRVAKRRVREAWKKNPLLGVAWVLWLPFAALRHYKAFTRTVAVLTAIACSVAVMIGTVQYWNNTTYALALTDDEGDVWGYVSDEAVYQDGVAKAKERLGDADGTEFSAISTSLSLQMIRRSDIWNKWQVCDRLLKTAHKDVNEACGIYIDNVFYGAVKSRRSAEQMLSGILTEHREGKTDVTASFVETVELVDGVFTESSIRPTMDIKSELTAEEGSEKRHTWVEGDTLSSVAARYEISLTELIKNNPSIEDGVQAGDSVIIQKSEPHLRVLVSGTVKYETEMPFAVERIPDSTMYEGNERVRVYGKNGTGIITATVTYLDGVEQFSAITESEILVQPVTQVVAYGTKLPIGAGKNYAWPTPCSRFVTQYFSMSGKRHSAIDIWAENMEGEDIVAADSGTVLIATDPSGTTYWSYGKYIVIDHGGGYQTLYSHCSELLVKPGDKVTKGQLIAKVGRTGRTTASHLHFEVMVNGKSVDPMLFY